MDFSDLAGRIRDHRFDGWTDTEIADQIQRMRDGDGTGSIGTAVDALKAVATALAHTDATLRSELLKLGVEWRSEAGGAAGQVFTEQAGFSRAATTKIAHAAETIFEQGEAFNRTKYKLPDPDVIRQGAGGYTTGDDIVSLIGFETDHAAKVDAANDARSQAVEALNAYAQESGTNLLSTEALDDPESLKLTPPGGGASVLDLAGSAAQVTPDGGVKPAADHVRSHYVAPPEVQQVVHHVPDPPTPAYGVGVRQTAATPVSDGTTTTASTRTPVSSPGSETPPAGWVSTPGRNPAEHSRPGGSAMPGEFVPPGTADGGPAPLTQPIRTPGGAAPGFPASGGSAVGGAPSGGAALGGGASGGSQAGGGAGLPGGGAEGAAEGVLPRGRMVGSVQQPAAPPAPASTVASAATSGSDGGASPGAIGAGVAAIGAGGIGGALSGDRERSGTTSSGPKGPVRPLPMAELPEEEAIALRKSEQISPRQPAADARYLDEAAPVVDAEHVRRYGVDDKDLFTDQRMVSRDVIDGGEVH